MRRRTLFTAAVATMGLAACADDKPKGDPSKSNDGEAPTSVPADREPPTIEVPAGDPPTELQTEDLIVGGGDEAKDGDAIAAHYTGVAWSNGDKFDSSWDRGEPFSFVLGAGQVIEGWDKGLQGMKVGGRRKVTIPPELGYGDRGAGDAIKPGETLIFVCDLVSVG